AHPRRVSAVSTPPGAARAASSPRGGSWGSPQAARSRTPASIHSCVLISSVSVGTSRQGPIRQRASVAPAVRARSAQAPRSAGPVLFAGPGGHADRLEPRASAQPTQPRRDGLADALPTGLLPSLRRGASPKGAGRQYAFFDRKPPRAVFTRILKSSPSDQFWM